MFPVSGLDGSDSPQFPISSRQVDVASITQIYGGAECHEWTRFGAECSVAALHRLMLIAKPGPNGSEREGPSSASLPGSPVV
ncbi:hypothetical protein SBA3_1090028 [Candidatus Sulfopaludibacter sp. SbA3]|nr:hypothetical protein SBA3_1090028 [Candidatus Sulfopaludibacter sp. SbA3]